MSAPAGDPRLPDTSLFQRSADPGRSRVLVVDDDPVARRLMAVVLGSADLEVVEAGDGTEALAVIERLAAERLPLDCLLLDVLMPGMDGPTLLERLAERGLVVPAMAVSAHADRDMVIRLMRLGCDEFVDKPVDPAQLPARVAAFLGRSRRATARRRERERTLSDEKDRLEREHERSRREAREATDSWARLNHQVETARTVYQDLIGNPAPLPGLDLSWRNRPLASMGGDYLGLRPGGSGAILLLADVAGHDLGASLHGVLVKALFEENCRLGLGGAGFLQRLNRQLLDAGGQRRLATALLIDIDPARLTATVVSAGHPAALLVRHGGTAEAVPAQGSVLGMAEDPVFHPVHLALAPGDRLFAATDGVFDTVRTDGRTGQRRRLGHDGLAAALAGPGPLAAAVEAGWQAALGHCRGRPADDMLLAGIELRRPDPASDYEPQTVAGDGQEPPTCSR